LPTERLSAPPAHAAAEALHGKPRQPRRSERPRPLGELLRDATVGGVALVGGRLGELSVHSGLRMDARAHEVSGSAVTGAGAVASAAQVDKAWARPRRWQPAGATEELGMRDTEPAAIGDWERSLRDWSLPFGLAQRSGRTRSPSPMGVVGGTHRDAPLVSPRSAPLVAHVVWTRDQRLAVTGNNQQSCLCVFERRAPHG
jgi:hypothetical protein